MLEALTTEESRIQNLVVNLTKSLAGGGNVSVNGDEMTIIKTSTTEEVIRLLTVSGLKINSESDRAECFDLSSIGQNSEQDTKLVTALADAVAEKISDTHTTAIKAANRAASNSFTQLAESVKKVAPASAKQFDRDARVMEQIGLTK
jgi:hypothetical protein